MRKIIFSGILSFLYTVFSIIGHTFIISNGFNDLLEHKIFYMFLFIILFVFFFFINHFLFSFLDKKRSMKTTLKKKWKIIELFEKHPILFSMFFIICAWLIYIIAFYPTIMSWDPSYQILQYFHIDNKYSYYSILLDENVIITNHHPVIHTLLLGTCVKIGLFLFHSTNVGLFIYSIIQILILSFALSYTIYFMKKINISLKYRILCLLIYAFVPVFPFYAMSPVKDVIFGSFIILYIISFFQLIKLEEKINIKNSLTLLLLMLLIILFRNNGIYVILLSFPFLILINSINRKRYLVILITIFSLFVTYDKILLPAFKITPSSIREVLSIPFQQTARYVTEHENEVTKEEKKAIDKILTYKTLKKRYNPEKSDPVKNKFNRFYTKEDLKNYFVVWWEMFLKHPRTYIEATIHNTYGYFYPLKSDWYLYYKHNDVLEKHGFDYHFNHLNILRSSLSIAGILFPFIPILGLLVNIGFNTWILIFMFFYLIYKQKYKEMFFLFPSLISLLVCIASPVNTYFRYALPNVFAMPVMLAIFYYIVKIEKN